ncbi:MAG: sulfotransferase domain-containing protein [Promethearchaeota archaeon]
MQKLLILGCRRSGTTLLASLIGAHSQVNMLDGCDKCIDKLIGKRYQGVKMTIPHIHYNRRSSDLWIFLYHKIAFLRKCFLKIGIQFDPHHGSKYSIKDFINMDAKIIYIFRDKKSNIESMIKRSKLTQKRAIRTYNKALKIHINLFEFYLSNHYVISFYQLTNFPEKILKNICKYLNLEYEPQMLNAAGLNERYSNTKIEKKK